MSLENKSKKEIVLNLIESYKESMTAKYISNILKINSSTVRGILRQLIKEGKIISENNFKGQYKINPMFEKLRDGFENLDNNTSHKYQNIIGVISLDKEIISEDEIFEYPLNYDKKLFKIQLTYGRVNKQLTIRLSSEIGYEIYSLNIMLDVIIKYVNVKHNCNLNIKNLYIKNIECFKDFFNIKMSENNVTYDLLEQWSLKVYNKKYGLRIEEKSFANIPIDLIFNSYYEPKILNYLTDMCILKNNFELIRKEIQYNNKLLFSEIRQIKDKLNYVHYVQK